ncbi:uncharacterized protein PV07_12323 [Cladophialophora immunda]|uniref:Uncharacterized protein n=1 Tax=Cladophialophora immunda TaxID=569365 RepID=A0A0D2BTS9_9EURO|nr:uncharacterized protein PV07_12323 [Cladophialophora immunda]KIW22438.1 hypothetical protein PV07_12323 [Cladophialophora immunda]
MIPLVAASELEANPAFARLWEYLTREALAEDGSSRKEERERERRWRAGRRTRSRREKGDGGRGGGLSGWRETGEEEVCGVGGDGVVRGGGAGLGYEDRDRNQEPEQEQEDEDEDVVEDDEGRDEDKKERQQSLSLDEQLHALRVERVKRRILRDVLEDAAHLDLSAGHTHAQGEDLRQGSESLQSRSAETRSRSGRRIPVPVSTTAPVTPAGAAKSDIADVTNKDLDLQSHATATEKFRTSGEMDNAGAVRPTGNYLPQSVGELVRVVSAYLHVSLEGSGDLFPSSNESDTRQLAFTQENGGTEEDEKEEGLLYEDILRFKANIAPIANAVSSRLVELESSLCVLSNIALDHSDDNEDEEYGRAEGMQGRMRPSQSLHESIQAQLSHLSDLRDTLLPSSLTTLNTTLQHLLTLQRHLLQLQIQHLETSKHGVLSRYTMSKIAFLDTVAQAMALKVQVLVLEARREFQFSPEVERKKEVIREKMAEVEKEEDELDERIRLLDGVLAEYEAVDPGTGIMGKLGVRYKEIEEEMEGVKRDIEKLQRQAAKR